MGSGNGKSAMVGRYGVHWSSAAAIALSRDRKWIMSGADRGASVRDAKAHDKVVHEVGTAIVLTVDTSDTNTSYYYRQLSVWMSPA